MKYSYFAAIVLIGCGGTDRTTNIYQVHVNEAGADGNVQPDPVSSGGSGSETTAGKAGKEETSGTSGKPDLGMAGTPDDLPDTGGTGSAGKANSDAGMAGLATAGTANGGAGNAGASTAGSGSAGAPNGGMPNAGTGGAPDGTGGYVSSIDNSNNCNAQGRAFNWTLPVWNWSSDGETSSCQAQINRIGRSVGSLVAPANCSWQYDVTSSDSWHGCQFTNTLSCTTAGSVTAFSVMVSSQFTDNNGDLSGTLYWQLDTAGGCSSIANSGMGSMGFTTQRY